jgi:hypothetical protein
MQQSLSHFRCNPGSKVNMSNCLLAITLALSPTISLGTAPASTVFDQNVNVEGAQTDGAAQDSDKRTFDVVSHAHASTGVFSVYVRLDDGLPGVADRASRVAVYRLADSLYLRVIPQGHRKVERGAFAYAFALSRDAAGETWLRPTNQPSHGVSANVPRAADFRNSDNTGPNETGPKNVNAAGAFREVEFADYVLEIRVLSFEIVGLGPSQVPAFVQLSCLVTVRPRGR